MHVHRITVKKFRLLLDCSVHFQENTTVIVGRNNSGKTSLTELFHRFLTDNVPTFNLEDFSLCTHEEFWSAYQQKIAGADEADIRMSLPEIEVDLLLSYDPSIDLGPLGDFVIDLDPECTKVKLQIRFALEGGKIDSFFENDQIDITKPGEEQREVFFKYMKERVPNYYKSTLSAVDPNDQTNRKPLDFSRLRALLRGDFINAQRGLDDLTHKDNDVLGRILEMLFANAKSDSASSDDNSVAKELEIAVLGIQEGIDTDFNNKLENLLPTFSLFGYPGLPDPRIKMETSLDVERLLKNHTRVRYAGLNGVHLPETYNGLGSRNLIFILLKLHEFFKTFRATEAAFGMHLIFIEEPEAHLHPQMQEVFINQLDKIVEAFSDAYNDGQKWPVQFVVTTHSSHLANKAPFEAMRYFLSQPSEIDSLVCVTKVKDLREGFLNTSEPDKAFLHQYMTLTRCDLLFADKAILIEGTCERLLLPEIIKKIDAVLPDDKKLASQYITSMEVGGAYAHIFLDLLNFLELPSLIITDLDPVKKNENNRYTSCLVNEGTRTGNACLKNWFNDPEITPEALIAKPDADKTQDTVHITYQIPEKIGEECGTTLEPAFILANPDLFTLVPPDERDPRTLPKSQFALKYAVEERNWTVPKYIKEGMFWLAGHDECEPPQTTTALKSPITDSSEGKIHA